MIAVLTALSLLVGGLVYWWPEGQPVEQQQVASGLASTSDGSTTPGAAVDWRTLAVPPDLATELPTTSSTTSSATGTVAPAPGSTQPPAPATSSAPRPKPSTSSSTTSSYPGNKPPNSNKPTKSPKPQDATRADCSVELFGVCL